MTAPHLQRWVLLLIFLVWASGGARRFQQQGEHLSALGDGNVVRWQIRLPGSQIVAVQAAGALDLIAAERDLPHGNGHQLVIAALQDRTGRLQWQRVFEGELAPWGNWDTVHSGLQVISDAVVVTRQENGELAPQDTIGLDLHSGRQRWLAQGASGPLYLRGGVLYSRLYGTPGLPEWDVVLLTAITLRSGASRVISLHIPRRPGCGPPQANAFAEHVTAQGYEADRADTCGWFRTRFHWKQLQGPPVVTPITSS